MRDPRSSDQGGVLLGNTQERQLVSAVVTTVSVTEAGGDGIITTEDEANFVLDRVLCWSRCFVIVGRSPTHLAQGGAGVGGHEVTPDVIHSPSGSGVCVPWRQGTPGS